MSRLSIEEADTDQHFAALADTVCDVDADQQTTVAEAFPAIADAWQPFATWFDSIFERMAWAEDEISKAAGRHPHARDLLWHAFSLLEPTHDRMRVEFVYRGHVRELLDRVARGEDTRPGTAAELVIGILEAAKLTPINQVGTGLLFRSWESAFPDCPIGDTGNDHREALMATRIDHHESESRGKLAVAKRRLTTITCDGQHHGDSVHCRFARKA